MLAAVAAVFTMVSMSEVTNMIEAAVKGALAHAARKDHSAGHLDERHFRRMDKFSGDPIKWREWAFQFKTAVGAVNNKTREFLEEIQKFRRTRIGRTFSKRQRTRTRRGCRRSCTT